MGYLKVLPLVLGAVAVLGVSACAPRRGNFDGPPPERMAEIRAEAQKQIAERDLNGDGILTCADTDIKRAELFQMVDEDGSKDLDAREYNALRWHDKLYVLLELPNDDKDGDGVVTLAELQARSDPFFNRVDVNQDCQVTPEELGLGFRPRRAGGESPGEGGGRRHWAVS